MLRNPALITPGKVDKLHYALRHPMRQSMIIEEDGIIFIRERIPNKNISISLRLVPKILRNTISLHFMQIQWEVTLLFTKRYTELDFDFTGHEW